MSESYVTVERDGPVALVKFDRKKNLNAFDGQLILELTDVARSFHDDLETRAVVLTSNSTSIKLFHCYVAIYTKERVFFFSLRLRFFGG